MFMSLSDGLVLLMGLFRILEGLLLLSLAYHYLFILASAFRAVAAPQGSQRKRSFALLIPAHNEQAVIAQTVRCARQLEYPADQYDVHVIADHCEDQTARLAEAAGAMVQVRSEGRRGRKGYALAWGLNRLLAREPAYDAFVILDADSLVDREFLNVMNAELDLSQGVLQGQRLVNNAQDSTLAAIAAVDQRLNNFLRNQARRALGWSCRLMGDAMCFAREVLLAYPWDSDSLVEDREYGAKLLLNGIRTRYVSGALVRQQAAVNWRSGQQQRLRWYRGAVEVQRRLAWQLIRRGLLQHNLAQLEGGLELVMPAYSTLTALTALVALVETLHATSLLAVIIGAALLAWVAYPILGLWLDRAPLSMYKALLLYGPIYMAWRVWLAVLTRLLGRRIQWVRTQRREETTDQVGASRRADET